MKKEEFLRKISEEKLNEFLLQELDIIVPEIIYKTINTFPDYNKTPYERGTFKTYYFKNSWNFKSDYDSIVSADILDYSNFCPIDLETIAEEFQLNENELNKTSYEEFLNYALQYDVKDELDNYGIKEWDEFKLHNLEIQNIDNTKKELTFEGSYSGELNYVQDSDFELVAKIKIKKFQKDFFQDNFYKQLLTEVYILNEEQKFKLSYFLAFSAIESFVNSNYQDNAQKRFNLKLKELCKRNLGDLSGNEIYTSIINEFPHFTKTRNDIAHGNDDIFISKTELLKFYNFSLLIIYINISNIKTFNELCDKITNANTV